MRKIISHLLSVGLVSVCLFAACDSTSKSGGSSPTPTPTPTEEERKAQAEKDKIDRKKAIDDFVLANFKGFELAGTAGPPPEENCDESETCELHLVKGGENKVVTVIIKKFQKGDGTSYWLVYEATRLDLSQIKINKVKETYLQRGREAEQEEQEELAAARDAEDGADGPW